MRFLFITKAAYLTVLVLVTAPMAYPRPSDDQALVIWIAMAGRTQLKQTQPGTTLNGKLTRPVYWRNTEVFPKGSGVRMVVDQIESRKKANAVDDRPFLIHLFAPRHELVARFRSVSVSIPGGVDVPMRAQFIALAQRAEITAQTSKPTGRWGDIAGPQDKPTRQKKPPKTTPPWVLTLRAEPEGTSFAGLAGTRPASDMGVASACPKPCAIAEGTQMPVFLSEGISAANNRQGQSFQAVLLEPVRVGSTVAIPQGSLIEGVLAKRVPPRRLYRPGSLYLRFNRLVIPNGMGAPMAASPVAAEVDRGTHMTMDSEGRIHAQNPGKARFLLDFGVTGGISKVSDDTTQLIMEAISSTATDASTAGVARIAAIGANAIFLLTRHGRDVILPAYTEMDVRLSRPVMLNSDAMSTAAPK